MMEITSEEQNKEWKELRIVSETSETRRKEERLWENFWRNYILKFPQHGKGNSQLSPTGTKSPIQDKPKEKHATATAKSPQSCPTLCNPIDGSPPGSPIPGILQARTLEWVAISFSNVWKWKVKVKSLSHVWVLATPWTAAHEAPPFMGFSRQEYWSGVPLPSLWKSVVLHK